jgi:hypothetical protein
MNWQHFRAFLWLRWRLFINQQRRGGLVNAIVLALFGIGAVLFAVGLFVTFLLIGLLALPEASPLVLLGIWDGLVVFFLFSWTLGLMMDLQRAEVLTLDKFLHLPVSLKSAYLINYLSSFFSLSLLVFLPPMLALSLALVVVKGPLMLLQFPLLAAFLLMVTALTYQFQGWLATLMANKRRRRTVIVLMTGLLILSCQIPNLANVLGLWQHLDGNPAALAHFAEEEQALNRDLAAGKIDAPEYQRKHAELQRQAKEEEDRLPQQLETTLQVANTVLPIGWLPLGAAEASDGRPLPALLGLLGMSAIGGFSLWRSYRTTLRLYMGQVGSRPRKAVQAAKPSGSAKPSRVVLERRLPGVSERVSAIALCTFYSLVRAPEAKLMLLSPLILLVVFGSMFWKHSVDSPLMLRPLIAFGAMAMTLLTMNQITANLFGFDRSGFRNFVLSAAPRRDILLGKNLGFAPVAGGLALFVIVLVQLVQPMRLEHFLATLPQLVSMYLAVCLLGNALSIFAPMAVRAGSFRAKNVSGLTILLHLVATLLWSLLLLPLLLPLGVEFALQQVGLDERLPICLLLSLVECLLVVWAYRLLLRWQGDLLQGRELEILATVTTRAE